MRQHDRIDVSAAGNVLSTLLLLITSVLFGVMVGVLGVPRLLPKVSLDSEWRDLPIVGEVLPVDLTGVRPALGQTMPAEVREVLDKLNAEKKKWEEKVSLIESREKACQEQAKTVTSAEKDMLAMQQQIEKKFKAMTIQIAESEKKNLRQLSKIYGQMKPDDAAQILRELDDETVVKILSLMKERQAGMALAAYARMDEKSAQRAGAISDKMRTVVATQGQPGKEARKN